jgi:hypothetical protein
MLRRSCLSAVLAPSLVVAGLDRRAAMAQSPGAPKFVSFADIRPGVSADVYLPAGWQAGGLTGGEKVLSSDPKLVIVGAIVGPSERVGGELRCLERPDAIEAPKWFAELALQRHKAKFEKGRILSGDKSVGDYISEYRTAEGRLFLERIKSGRKYALSIFMATAENQVLLDDIQAILVKSKLVVV